MHNALLRHLVTFRAVPSRALVATALASAGGLSVALASGWPLWGLALAILLPWIPSLTAEAVWTQRAYPGLALFYLLVVTQVGHFLEHVCQMLQIHAWGLQGAAARGVFGALDIEWVHFTWNTWVIAAALLLLNHFRDNRWLRLTVLLAVWHQVEHTYIMLVYLSTGVTGTPGLLAQGGALGGGLPLARADLHFLYNLIESTPLVVAFLHQIGRAYAEASAGTAAEPRTAVAAS